MMRILISGLMAGASGIVLASPALAQTSDPGPGVTESSELVVTGSRIRRDGYTAPTPVTVAPVEDLVRSTPTNIPDALNKLPQLTSSFSPARSSHNFANTANHGNYLNLRGIGALRTLTLFDGQRIQPGNHLGYTNVDVLPNILVERVEIVTGGASAQYGSDAVSGVVNYVLDDDFTGIKGLAQYGQDYEGTNGAYRLGLAFGSEFAGGRGHFLLSAESEESDGMLRGDRDVHRANYIFAGSTGVGGPGSPTNPYTLYPNGRLTAGYDYGKIVGTGGPVNAAFPYLNYVFDPSAGLRPFNTGQATGTAGFQSGGDGYIIPDNTTSIAPLENNRIFARGSYELAPGLEAYAQGIYSQTQTDYISLANSFVGVTLATLHQGNPYLPAEIEAALAPDQFINVAQYNGQGPLPRSEESTDFWMGSIGLRGAFGAGWNWDVAYTRGETQTDVAQHGLYDWLKTYAALDAVDNGSGQVVCRTSLDPDPAVRAKFEGCQPLNVVGVDPSVATPEGYAYATGTSAYTATIDQQVLAANVAGNLFDLPAGPLSVAAGAEWRTQDLSLTSNADPALLDTAAERTAYFSGLRNVPATATTRFWLLNVGTAEGSQDVTEGYLEVSAPLLSDMPLFQYLEANGAVRVTDYSTSGSVTTWKAGLQWRPVEDLLIRATRSRDIRAPNLYEQFAGVQANIGIVNDVVVNGYGSGQNVNVNQEISGNPNLAPEEADTFTLGFAFTPSFLEGFSISVDYFSIEMDGLIADLSAQQTVTNCNQSQGAAPECAFVVRPNNDPSQFPTLVRRQPQNIASLETAGIDIDATYRTTLGPGDLALRLYMAYLDKFETEQYAGAGVIDYVGLLEADTVPEGRPEWRGLLSVNYSYGDWGLYITENYIGKGHIGIASTNPAATSNFIYDEVDAEWTTDVTTDYTFQVQGGELQAFLTVNNLFNNDPPLIPGTVPGGGFPTVYGLYDQIGRMYTAGVRFRF